MRRHRWRAVLMSWLLLIIVAVALAATMVGWAAVVASSLNHTMHALNGSATPCEDDHVTKRIRPNPSN